METVRLDEGLSRTVLPNGLVLLTETMPGVRSVAAGIWVRSASAHESRSRMGVSHLLEHMVFKATERRSARQVALELEARGGALDAYTSRDHTSYQAHVLAEDLPRAVDVLTDLVRRPLLREEDLVPERNVVLEEIGTVEDTPDDQVFELFSEHLWRDHPYGYSILGTRDTVSRLSAADLREAHTAGYYPGNCVITAAGRVEHERLLDLLAHEGWLESAAPGEPRPGVTPGAASRGATHVIERDTALTHLVFGTDTIPYRDPRRFALSILANVFGGGMSSRLFQRIREELGLAYAVYAFQQFYQSSGIACVYVGTGPSTADRAAEAVQAEYARLAAEGLTEDELEDGRCQLKGQLSISLESPQRKMGWIATQELQREPYRPLDQVMQDIAAVSRETVAALAAEYFDPARQTVVRLGPTH